MTWDMGRYVTHEELEKRERQLRKDLVRVIEGEVQSQLNERDQALRVEFEKFVGAIADEILVYGLGRPIGEVNSAVRDIRGRFLRGGFQLKGE